MEEHLKRALEKQARELAGPTPMEQHIILLRLTDLLENSPLFGAVPVLEAESPQRKWLADIGALLSRLDLEKKTIFKIAMQFARQNWTNSIDSIKGAALDAAAELKLNLELSGRAEIGTAYAPGEVYKFFSDLKSIVNGAESNIFLVDPYFNGNAFDHYLSNLGNQINIRIFANNYSSEILGYVSKHQVQYNSIIELKSSRELHDRLIFIDNQDCWIMGGSIKDAGKKPTYLIPIVGELAKEKKAIYESIWSNSHLLK